MSLTRMVKNSILVFSLLFYLATLSYVRYQQYWGSWNVEDCKTIYYFITSVFGIYVTIDEQIVYNGDINRSFSLLCKWSVYSNFALFALARLKVRDVVTDIFLLDIVLFVLLVIICLKYWLKNRKVA